MSALKSAGKQMVSSSPRSSSGVSEPTPKPKLSMFQKLKIEVSMAKKYNGDTRKIPAKKLEDVFTKRPGKLLAKMNEELGLNFESLEQKKKQMHKQRRERHQGDVNSDDEDDDPYQLKALLKKRQAVCADAETGEKIRIPEQLPDDVAYSGRRIDNMLWRKQLMVELKDALDHPEYINHAVLKRALEQYRADPANAVPQPMSLPSKYEKKGKVYAMLQSLRQTHAKQTYDMVLEEEERDKKRTQLMDWAKDDPVRVAQLVERFKDERRRWREFIAIVQHDNQMRLAHIMTQYGLLR